MPARSLRPRLADMDLWRGRPPGQVHSRRGQQTRRGDHVAGFRRLHHLRCAAPPHAAVHRRARAFLCTGGERVILPDADIGRGARLSNVIVEKGVHIPPAWWWARTPRTMRRRFRRTEKGICLITKPMIDRLTGESGFSPSFPDLPAGQDRWPRRRGRGVAGGLVRRGRPRSHPGTRLSRRTAPVDRSAPVLDMAELFGGTARVCPAARPGWTCS